MRSRIAMLAALLAALHCAAAEHSLRDALTLYASFDKGTDAEIARGDKQLYNAPKMVSSANAKPGLPENNSVTIEKGKGLGGGDCLRFATKDPGMVFYWAKGNLPYDPANWNGTVSFWLRVTPDEDLEPGYTDPIQITSKGWDDASFFVEFTKDEKPREFRLGAYADKKVWNPNDRDWNAIPMDEKPLVRVIRPPFTREAWTHVVFTFEQYNTGQKNGVTTLYLNGEKKGALTPRQQTFTWDYEKAMIMLGLSYKGLFDELAIFNRALSESEIRSLHSSKPGHLK